MPSAEIELNGMPATLVMGAADGIRNAALSETIESFGGAGYVEDTQHHST